MFSREICKIIENTYFEEHLVTTAFVDDSNWSREAAKNKNQKGEENVVAETVLSTLAIDNLYINLSEIYIFISTVSISILIRLENSKHMRMFQTYSQPQNREKNPF